MPEATTHRHEIFQDWKSNAGNPKGRLILVAFRAAHWARCSHAITAKVLRYPVGVLYRLCVEWLLGVELPWRTRVGESLRLFHGTGLVVNDAAVIGSNVVLRHNVTIGHRKPDGPCPTIGDSVDIGAGAILIGGIQVGAGARIGAGALVIEDVPPQSSVLGQAAKILPPEHHNRAGGFGDYSPPRG